MLYPLSYEGSHRLVPVVRIDATPSCLATEKARSALRRR